MNTALRHGAAVMQAQLRRGGVTPGDFRAALLAVPGAERDAWVDAVLGLEEVPDDGPGLPRGGVPYLPCSVDAVLRAVELAGIGPRDVFADLGSGVGRVTALVHLLTGAPAIGVEIQPDLVRASRQLIARLGLENVAVMEGDAAVLVQRLVACSVFFLYCPFSGERLERTVDQLEELSHARPLRVCCVDLPLPERAWLSRAATAEGGVTVHRSTPPPAWAYLTRAS